jgi:iron only hydrogenase large subunit-like protein
LKHSVTLDKDKCKGCTTCIKHCPTEAIRVRRGIAHITEERCIDCGNCIRVCPHKAKKAVCDDFDRLKEFEYNIALPAPSLYGQFRNLTDVNQVLTAFLHIGFDHVEEVARGAELVSSLTKYEMESDPNLPKPLISSACPAAVRLICQRFPKLIPHISKVSAPFEIVAILARQEAVERTGLPPEKIGVFFITPCPAKVSAGRNPAGLETPVVDGFFAISDIYKRLINAMKNIDEPQKLAHSGLIGVGWAHCGGESNAVFQGQHLAVDGIDNIIEVLEDLEDGLLPQIDFLELNACNQGCVGGCLTVENPYVAQTRIKQLIQHMPISMNKVSTEPKPPSYMFDDKPLEASPVNVLDDDIEVAMQKYAQIEKLVETLPGLDCGSCGAPTCKTLAEDIVQGLASEDDCIFRMRERMQYLMGMGDADEYLPLPFRRRDEEAEKAEQERNEP